MKKIFFIILMSMTGLSLNAYQYTILNRTEIPINITLHFNLGPLFNMRPFQFRIPSGTTKMIDSATLKDIPSSVCLKKIEAEPGSVQENEPYSKEKLAQMSDQTSLEIKPVEQCSNHIFLINEIRNKLVIKLVDERS